MSAKTQTANLLQLNILPRHFIYNQDLLYKAIPLPLISFFISQFTNYSLFVSHMKYWIHLCMLFEYSLSVSFLKSYWMITWKFVQKKPQQTQTVYLAF